MAERAGHELISEINALWAGHLEQIPAEWIPRGVAPNVTEFLTTVGLPTIEVGNHTFVHDERMSHLIDYLDRHYLLLATANSMLPWVDDSWPSWMADPDNGRVSLPSGSRSPHPIFVNSSLPQFLVALRVWHRDIWVPPMMTAEEGLTVYERFERFLADHDPAAAEAGAYWPTELERRREGIEL
ncbi:SUKH-4 family immunity protein [Nocardia sp. NPDC050630]|uniref:SUKH-4 family immunity protein n=1 Tax=Nocardia sp. NPDC050630 TaxID=3364321 RepID=UPI0037A02899